MQTPNFLTQKSSPSTKKLTQARLLFNGRLSELRPVLKRLEGKLNEADLKTMKVAASKLQKALENLSVCEKDMEVNTLSIIKSCSDKIKKCSEKDELFKSLSLQVTAFEVIADKIDMTGENILLDKLKVASSEMDKAVMTMMKSFK